MKAHARVVDPARYYHEAAAARTGHLLSAFIKESEPPDPREQEDRYAPNGATVAEGHEMPPEISMEQTRHNYLRIVSTEGLEAQNVSYAGLALNQEIGAQANKGGRNPRDNSSYRTIWLIQMMNERALEERISELEREAEEARREAREAAEKQDAMLKLTDDLAAYVMDANITLSALAAGKGTSAEIIARASAIRLLRSHNVKVDDDVKTDDLKRLLEEERDRAQREKIEAAREAERQQEIREEAERRARELQEEAERLQEELDKVRAAVKNNELSPEEGDIELKKVFDRHSLAAMRYGTAQGDEVDPSIMRQALLDKTAPANHFGLADGGDGNMKQLEEQFSGFSEMAATTTPVNTGAAMPVKFK